MREHPFISTQHLLDYVLGLARVLEAKGLSEPSKQLVQAGRFASGAPTEFFDEARTALQAVLDTHAEALSDSEMFALRSALGNIEREFTRISGD
jgi:hypothetical protein